MSDLNSISDEEVKHIAELAKLSLNEEETKKYSSELTNILNMIDSLNKVNTDDVKPTTNMSKELARLREDKAVINKGECEALLNNAPEIENGFIKVPSIINEEEK